MRSLNLRLFLSFILALLLGILPMPALLMGIKPMWVLMLLLYLQFYLPDYFQLNILLILGLFLDALLSTVIGEHILALSLVTWIASSKARRFHFFSIGQQVGLIGFFCLLYQLIIMSIDAFLGFHLSVVTVLGSTILSMALWPFLRLLAQGFFAQQIRSY